MEVVIWVKLEALLFETNLAIRSVYLGIGREETNLQRR